MTKNLPLQMKNQTNKRRNKLKNKKLKNSCDSFRSYKNYYFKISYHLL